MEKIAVVFVCNQVYFNKFRETYHQLRENGKYKGDVVLLIGNDIEEEEIKIEGLIVKKFKEIEFSEGFKKNLENVKTDGRNKTKLFQWHKLYLFNIYFKEWDFIFYIDCGMKIFNDITPMLDCRERGKILGHSDSYPLYKRKLYDQFDLTLKPFDKKLLGKFGLRGLAIDYPQTGILLYDTRIIELNTFDELKNLAEEFPNTKTNEQAIVALYFTNIRRLWKQIQLENNETKFYDFCRRMNPRNKPYIMYKSDLIMKKH